VEFAHADVVGESGEEEEEGDDDEDEGEWRVLDQQARRRRRDGQAGDRDVSLVILSRVGGRQAGELRARKGMSARGGGRDGDELMTTVAGIGWRWMGGCPRGQENTPDAYKIRGEDYRKGFCSNKELAKGGRANLLRFVGNAPGFSCWGSEEDRLLDPPFGA